MSRVLRYIVTRNVRPPGRSDARPRISCCSSWEALAAPLDISSARRAVHLTCARDRDPYGPETPGGSGREPEALSDRTRPATINKSARARGCGHSLPPLPAGICRGGWPCRFDFRDASRTRRRDFLMTDESAAAASWPSHYRASLRARSRSADM